MLTSLYSLNSTINDELEKYVGGVYTKTVYSSAISAVGEVTFIQPISCVDLYPDTDRVHENLFFGYNCPMVEQFTL